MPRVAARSSAVTHRGEPEDDRRGAQAGDDVLKVGEEGARVGDDEGDQQDAERDEEVADLALGRRRVGGLRPDPLVQDDVDRLRREHVRDEDVNAERDRRNDPQSAGRDREEQEGVVAAPNREAGL